MDVIMPRTCGGCPTPVAGRAKWCSDACRVRIFRSANAQSVSAQQRARRKPVGCLACGTTFLTHRALSCGPICKIFAKTGAWPVSDWPRWTVERRDCAHCETSFLAQRRTSIYCQAQCADRAADLRRRVHPNWQPGPADCAWCGTEFEALSPHSAYCDQACGQRASRMRRRGRIADVGGTYTQAELRILYASFGHASAYCEQACEPEPDHVVPLARGGANLIGNLLPACRACNSDKRDLLLPEWVSDRDRRGLDPRVTSWAPGDPRVRHLTCLAGHVHAA